MREGKIDPSVSERPEGSPLEVQRRAVRRPARLGDEEERVADVGEGELLDVPEGGHAGVLALSLSAPVPDQEGERFEGWRRLGRHARTLPRRFRSAGEELSAGRGGSQRSFWRSRNERQRASTSGSTSPAVSVTGLGSTRSMRLVTPARSYSSWDRRSLSAARRWFAHAVGGGTGGHRDGHPTLGDGDGLGNDRLFDRGVLEGGLGRLSLMGLRLVAAELRLQIEEVREDFLLVLAHPLRLSVSPIGIPRLERPCYSTLRPLLNPTFGYGFRAMRTLTRLSVTPVKALRLSHPVEAELTAGRIPADRRFYLIDEQGGLFDASDLGALMQIVPAYDPAAERLRLSFPDGSVVEDAVDRLGEASSATDFFGRMVDGHLVEGAVRGGPFDVRRPARPARTGDPRR